MNVRFILTGLLTSALNLLLHAAVFVVFLKDFFAAHPAGSPEFLRQLNRGMGELVLWAAIPTAATASRDERHAATLSAVRGLARASGGITSVSHTREVSLVLHGPDPERFGIDLERTTPERSRLAGRVRSDLESATLPLDAPWIDVLRCFCAKEAAFKALASEAQAGLTFRRLAVDRAAPSGTAWVRRVADGLIVAEACVVADANLVVAVAKAVLSK